MALGGLPGAPGPPRARVKKPKNQYFLQGPLERPSLCCVRIVSYRIGRSPGLVLYKLMAPRQPAIYTILGPGAPSGQASPTLYWSNGGRRS